MVNLNIVQTIVTDYFVILMIDVQMLSSYTSSSWARYSSQERDLTELKARLNDIKEIGKRHNIISTQDMKISQHDVYSSNIWC